MCLFINFLGKIFFLCKLNPVTCAHFLRFLFLCFQSCLGSLLSAYQYVKIPSLPPFGKPLLPLQATDLVLFISEIIENTSYSIFVFIYSLLRALSSAPIICQIVSYKRPLPGCSSSGLSVTSLRPPCSYMRLGAFFPWNVKLILSWFSISLSDYF